MKQSVMWPLVRLNSGVHIGGACRRVGGRDATARPWNTSLQDPSPPAGRLLEDLDLDSIADEQARALVRRLLNLLEDVRTDLRAAQVEIQRLRNEINRLKGEQGQPAIKPNTPHPPPRDLSSEQERHTPQAWSKGRKTDRIPIDREHVVAVDPADLPPDAVFKGYE